MNYYEHHLGDYAAATAHLSWDEDMAYTRLLRAYYHHERGIPDGDRYRLARAIGKPQRAAVDVVLNEFFYLKDGQWRQKRADAEIERFTSGEPERIAKKANESNRMKRHRDERAALFKTLTGAGGHAPWNINMHDLRALVAALHATSPETLLPPLHATAPATPATATHTPNTSTKDQELPATPGENTPEPDPIFGVGLDFLKRKGVPEKPARSFLGLLRKELHDDLTVCELLGEAERQDVSNPQAWLTAAAKQRKGQANANSSTSRKLSVVDQVEAAIEERNRKREREPIQGAVIRTVTG